MEIVISDLKSLQQFASKFVKCIRGGEVIALQGDLGAGKTAFCKALLKAARVKKRVSSPTFVLMIPYQSGKKTFYHMDLYRISGYKDILALGVEDLWNKPENVFLIEWADKISRHLPKKTITIKLNLVDDEHSSTKRNLRIENAPKYFKI